MCFHMQHCAYLDATTCVCVSVFANKKSTEIIVRLGYSGKRRKFERCLCISVSKRIFFGKQLQNKHFLILLSDSCGVICKTAQFTRTLDTLLKSLFYLSISFLWESAYCSCCNLWCVYWEGKDHWFVRFLCSCYLLSFYYCHFPIFVSDSSCEILVITR